VPVRRRPSIRRQAKAVPAPEPVEPVSAAVAEPEGSEPVVAEPVVAEPVVAEPVLASPVVTLPEVPEVAEATEPVPTVEPEAAPVVEPVEQPVVDEEPAAMAAVAEPAPKTRGRRKGRAVPVEVEEPTAAEPEAEESAAPVAAAAVAVPVVAAVASEPEPEAQAAAQPDDGSWWDERPGDDEGEDGDQEAAAKPKRKWNRSSLLLLLLAILLVVGAAITGGVYWYKVAHTPTFVDMNGNKVIPDDNSVFDPAYVQAADAQPDLGQRFKVPSVSLDVPLGSVNQVNGLINPPGYTSVYWVKNMGVSLANADKGTVYVVTHSVKAPGEAPGDYLIDQKTTTVVLAQGAEIDVGDRKYTVDSSMTVSKDELGSQTSLWAGTPGMLVLITCMQGGLYLSNGHSATNVVIIGTLVS